MTNILVINAGSSSLKYQLLNMENKSVLANGICERIGTEGSSITYKAGGTKTKVLKLMEGHVDAVKYVIEALTDPQTGVVKSMDEISAVGHRVAHGGETFKKSVLIDDSVMKAIRDNIPLAPLHNPANIMGIEACKKVMPHAPMVAVFDTAFHQTMPPKAFIYGLPYDDYLTYKVRRYGFHGTSHSYVAQRAAALVGRPIEELKIITCHLGNGASIAAIQYGKSVDTSMGMTPLQGVTMGTRCGDIDPGIIMHLAEKKGFDFKQIDKYLYRDSGILGISGVSSDFRDIDDAARQGNKRAILARDVFTYSVKKYIGSYTAAMNGVDIVVFTGGIGENDGVVREGCASDLDYLGIELDKKVNDTAPRGEEVRISKPNSKVQVWIIPTNEELMIANDTYNLTKK